MPRLEDGTQSSGYLLGNLENNNLSDVRLTTIRDTEKMPVRAHPPHPLRSQRLQRNGFNLAEQADVEHFLKCHMKILPG